MRVDNKEELVKLWESSSSSSSSSLKFLEWPKQQRHHEDHYNINIRIPIHKFLKDSSTLRDGAFFDNLAYVSGKLIRSS